MAHLRSSGRLRYGEVFLVLVPNPDGTNDRITTIDPSAFGFDEERAASYGRTQVQGWYLQYPEVFLGMDKPANRKKGFRDARRV